MTKTEAHRSTAQHSGGARAPRRSAAAGGEIVSALRKGGFIVPQNNLALEQKYGAGWLLDISGGWRHGPWSATLGVDNVTNRYPDKTTSAGNLDTNGIFPYSNFSPFGVDGREVNPKVAYAW